MKKSSPILILSAGFAAFESVLAIGYLTSCHAPLCITAQGTGYLLSLYSIPLALGGWSIFGVALVWRGRIPAQWRVAGFDRDTFDLIMRMRGGASRLAILRLLTAPKHKNELSRLTGFDWKEVDRQLRLLESYGLVSVYAESGSVKLYSVTRQGELLLSLIEKLSGEQPKNSSDISAVRPSNSIQEQLGRGSQ